MTDPDHDPDVNVRQAGVNSGYAAFQIAKVLTTSEQHDDPATRERAQKKVDKWETVLRNILSGAIDYGSRTPVDGVPGWATLEVVTGGLATGGLLAVSYWPAAPLIPGPLQVGTSGESGSFWPGTLRSAVCLIH
jgi:hypothetical protein